MSAIASINTELFKRGDFSFIVERDGVRHTKQEEALRILTNNSTVEFLYGGAAGGAKSWTGCVWEAMMCMAYPETKWFIGREELKRLRSSTLITFFKVCKAYDIKKGEDFKYNGQDHYVEFTNGSRIDLLDLQYLPSDPEYERYGSIEYTGGWIEEGGEVNFGAYDTLKTRIGRHNNDKYGLLRKLFISCNPKKNWMYTEFYKPSIKGTLKPYQRYLPALVQDNPFIDKAYIDGLQTTQNKTKKERLFLGNWEYDDSPNAMCSYDDIMEIFNPKEDDDNTTYLTADIARFGSDKARILVWRGWNIIEYHSFNTSSITDLQACIEAMINKYNIARHHCVADEDGVGGGVVDNCRIKGFMNNAAPVDGENYKNYQTQCIYRLASKINNYEVSFHCHVSSEDKDQIATELGQIQTWDVDNDRKLSVKPKSEIKQDIGYSPDWRDALMMRVHFDFKGVDYNRLIELQQQLKNISL